MKFQVRSGPALLVVTSDFLGGDGSVESSSPNKTSKSDAAPALGAAGSAAANTTSAGRYIALSEGYAST